MAGFDVDPVALRSAVNKLKDQREELTHLLEDAGRGLMIGELTAGDSVTKQAKTKFEQLAHGGDGSMVAAVRSLRDRLTQNIDAYEATLRQYESDDDAAASDAERLHHSS